MKNKIKHIVLLSFLLSFIFAGCASVPKGSERLTQQSKSFVAPPGKSNVYVIRPYSYAGSAIVWTVSIDYREFGTLGLSSYLYGAIPPGVHFVGAGGFGGSTSTNRVKFKAEEGENYFFKISPGFISITISQIDEEKGKNYVSKFKLSGDNIFEVKDILKRNSLGF